MADATGMHSYGTILFEAVFTAGSPAGVTIPDAGNGIYGPLDEVISMNGVPVQAAVTRLTHLLSDGKGHEKVPGFIDGGQLTFRMNYSHALMAALAALVPGANEAAPDWGRKSWVVQMPDGGQFYFIGFVQGLPIEVPEDDRNTIEVTIEISGVPTFISPV